MSDPVYFALYKNDCLRCSHLIKSKEAGLKLRAFASCHHTKGNAHCPALEVAVVIVGKAYYYAERVARARQERDAEKEVALMKIVSTQNEAFKSKFYSHLESL